MEIRCEKCNHIINLEEKDIDTNLEYMQCSNCLAITKNPFYKK